MYRRTRNVRVAFSKVSCAIVNFILSKYLLLCLWRREPLANPSLLKRPDALRVAIRQIIFTKDAVVDGSNWLNGMSVEPRKT